MPVMITKAKAKAKSNMIDDAIFKMKQKEAIDDKLNTLYLLRGKLQELIITLEHAKKDLR